MLSFFSQNTEFRQNKPIRYIISWITRRDLLKKGPRDTLCLRFATTTVNSHHGVGEEAELAFSLNNCAPKIW